MNVQMNSIYTLDVRTIRKSPHLMLFLMDAQFAEGKHVVYKSHCNWNEQDLDASEEYATQRKRGRHFVLAQRSNHRANIEM